MSAATLDPPTLPDALAGDTSQFADAIERYRAALPPGRIMPFTLTPLDFTGVPVWVSSYRGDSGHLDDGIGYGASREEALCGAHGELAETATIADTLTSIDSVDAESTRRMTDRYGDEVIDPRRLALSPGCGFDLDRPIDWVAATRYPDGARRWVPREFAAQTKNHLRGCPPLITPITNGLGAGPSMDHAVEHAVCEILQRDGNCTAFRAMDRGHLIEPDEINDPPLAALIEHVDSLGIRIYPKLARVEFDMVNVFVVGHDVGDDPWFAPQVTACGEAAHPDREVAIRKATLEFLAARARKAFMHGPLDRIEAIAPDGYLDSYFDRFDPSLEEPRALRAMTDWVRSGADTLRDRLSETVFAVNETTPLSDLPTHASGMDVEGAGGRLDLLHRRLAADGIEILTVEMSDDRARDAGIHAVRVIAPGTECETMSYGRIGYRGLRRAFDEGYDFVSKTDLGDGWQRAELTDDDRERLGHDAYVSHDRIAAIVGDLYPLYREPRSHSVQRAIGNHV